MSVHADSLISSLRTLAEFADKHKGEWLGIDAMRAPEKLDAQIETLCRELSIDRPSPRSPPSGMGICYFGFTQLPFWWKVHPRVFWLNDPAPSEADPDPDEDMRMLDPDADWRAAVSRLIALAAAKQPEGAGERGLSEIAKPDEGTGGSGKRHLKPSRKKAYQLFHWAIEQGPTG